MLEMIKEVKKNMVLLAVIYLILGVILAAFPEVSGMVICYLIGGLAVVYGIAHLVMYFSSKLSVSIYRYDLAYGIIGVGVGIYIIAVPQILMGVLPIVLGLVVLVDSVVKVQNSWDLKRMGYDKWWIVMIGALITLLFGFLMIFYPFAAYFSIIMFVGISLIVNGVCDLATIFILTKKVKEFKEKVEDAVIDAEAKEEIIEEE